MKPLQLIKHYYLNPDTLVHRIIMRCSKLISDKFIISLLFLYTFGRKIDWKHPKTFSEKLQWLKIYDRKPIHTVMVDKYAAKAWIEERIGPGYVVPNLGVWDSFDQIDFDTLPDQFVLKTTHDSGGVVVVKDKNTFDKEAAKQKLERSLKRDFYLLFREWPYKDVPRKIIAEKYLEDESGDLTDYKFYCFNGVPQIMYIAQGFGNPNLSHVIDYFDMDFNHLDLIRHYSMAAKIPQKPGNWNSMIEFAKIVSKDEFFLRVDFFEANGKLYLGELTFFPGAGLEKMEPEEWDNRLGEWLKLPTDTLAHNA